jgi:hypothetical protein
MYLGRAEIMDMFPIEYRGGCPDPEISATGSRKVDKRGGGATQAKLDPAPPNAGGGEGGGSRVPVTKEEAWAKNAPYSFNTWRKQSQPPTQWELVYYSMIPLYALLQIMYVSLYVFVISVFLPGE